MSENNFNIFDIKFFRDPNFGIFYSGLDRKISKIPKPGIGILGFHGFLTIGIFRDILIRIFLYSRIFIPGIWDFLPSEYSGDFLSPGSGFIRDNNGSDLVSNLENLHCKF